MSTQSRTTVYDLGVDVSTRYANDQTKLNTPFVKDIKESPYISRTTQIGVYTPSKFSELEALMGSAATKQTIARFTAPEQRPATAIFSYQLVPSLGSDEKQENLMMRIKEQIDQNKVHRDKEKEEGKDKKRFLWEKGEEEKKEEKEKEALFGLFKIIGYLNKCLIDVNARRSQFQQG